VVELRPDAVLAGKLRLEKPLGHGGMGVVWAARHLTLDADVAVKLIRPDRAAVDRALVTRFEREAKAAARITHPNVVKVMDYGTVDAATLDDAGEAEGAVPYIVMERLRGFSLAELLERGGRLSFATARSFVEQVGSALESAHGQGIVHRDIKPHNVFVTEGPKRYPIFVKVLDFGVAKMLGDSQVPGGSATLTETGTIIGSPPYMSPEQLEGRKDVDLRSDLWSLAVVVYETLTGKQPFVGGSFVAVGAAVLKGTYRPAGELRADLPRSIDDWFAKALCLDPDGRFQSAREMVAAFSGPEASGDEPLLLAPEAATAAGAFDTTMVAAMGGTESHVPAAERPSDSVALEKPSLGDTSARPRVGGRRGKLLLAMGFGALAVLGAVVAAPLRLAGSAGCPAGMVLIEGRAYAMGSPEDAETPTDETPRHEVAVESFCLDMTEVTVKAYNDCTSCTPPPLTVDFEGLTPNGRSFESQFCHGAQSENHPINCVDWSQAKAYCAALGKRLPTEQEWELAARGNDERRYPWGNDDATADRLNACGSECSRMLSERRRAVGKGPWPAMYAADDGVPAAAAVGSYPKGAAPSGVLDMAGNVWEWTESPYCPYLRSDCGDSRRVLRGGGWDSTEVADVRTARRYPSAPTARGRSIGFRCAATP
jgi:formylglycine-generating enzyme required for sulfatase activity